MTAGGAFRGERQASSSFALHVSEKSYYSRDNYSRRLFVMPSSSWILQLTRGHLSNLDQLEAARDVRRTIVSATYNSSFDMGVWQTTFAWGHHSSNISPNTAGYLAESLFRLGNAHTLFGRLERVRSDDLLRDNESLHADMFKLNKLTLGYYYDVPTGSGSKVDVGGMVSRYSVPSSMAATYGNNPTAVFMFIRLQLR